MESQVTTEATLHNNLSTDKRERIKYILKRDLIILSVGIAYLIFVLSTGIAIPCMVKTITGFECPGCGFTRAFVALARGHLAEAFSCNPFLFVVSPIILYLIVKSDIIYIIKGKYIYSKVDEIISIVLVTAAIVFAIFRNLN